MEDVTQNGGTTALEPELLYHYTDQNGLLGIIQQKRIWCTSVSYLNDTTEGRIVFGAIADEFNRRYRFGGGLLGFDLQPPSTDEVVEPANEDILAQGSSTALWIASQNVFVTSFSEQGNSLSQWRAYAGKSGGYSIGFRSSYLRECGKTFLEKRSDKFYSEPVVLARCQYFDNAYVSL